MSDVWGGGLVVVAAAVLWLVYLIPTWLRRREYLATERNAVRLQQTLRVLAETSELPEEVRLETNARTFAEQQRMLRQAEARAVLPAGARAIPAPRRRARRVRATTSLILLISLAVAAYGASLGVSAGTWYPLATAAIVAAGCVAMLVRLARISRRRAQAPVVAAPPAPAPNELYDDADHADERPARLERTSAPWTPQPLPKPLYLSRGTIAASAMASVDAAAALRRAAAAADLERRVAELAPPVPQLQPSRFARMGIVAADDAVAIDLDEALRRRRTAS